MRMRTHTHTRIVIFNILYASRMENAVFLIEIEGSPFIFLIPAMLNMQREAFSRFSFYSKGMFKSYMQWSWEGRA